MSVGYSTASVSTIQGGFYVEQQVKVEKVQVEKMAHLFPVLQELEIPGKEGSNPTVEHYIEDLEDGKGISIQRLPIPFRNKDPEVLQRQLSVIKTHYAIQLLFISERTRRRALVTQELTAMTSIITKLEYSLPLKEKLMALWSCRLAEKLITDMSQEVDTRGPVASVLDVSTTTADTDAVSLVLSKEHEESGVASSTDLSSQLRIQGTMRERFTDTINNFENTVNTMLGKTMRPDERRGKR